MTKTEAKFKVGEVVAVAIGDSTRPQYGRVKTSRYSMDSHIYTLEFWDADNGDVWTFGYSEAELRKLTRREKGD